LIHISAAPAMAIAVLIIPLYDTLRVFTMRLLNKKSPFIADRNHIHHKLLDLGLSHNKATVILILVNLLFIISSYFLQFLGNMYLMILQLFVATVFTFLLFSMKSKKKVIVSKMNEIQFSVEMETPQNSLH
jgi:hypothetical protein